MKSKRNKTFRDLLAALPIDVKRQAYAAYRQFKRDPFHPSLQFKRVSERRLLYSVRIGANHRALGIREADDVVVWIWIGSHAEYDKILSR
jgi:hypothetical protein